MKGFIVTAAAIAGVLGGCGQGQRNEDGDRVGFTVTGPRSAVEQFGREQGTKDQALTLWSFEELDGGRSAATVWLPAGVDGKVIVPLTRAAVAAGLSYRAGGKRLVREGGSLKQ